MSRPKRPSFAHRLEYVVFRTVEFSLNRLSLETCFGAGEFLGRVLFRLLGKRRRQVIRNLRFAYGGEKSPAEITELAALVFERTAANLVCSLRIPFLDDSELSQHFELKGTSEFEAVHSRQGAVVLVPHMGNWELVAQAPFLFYPDGNFATHYRPLNNPLINRVIERRRKKRGLQLFAKNASPYQMTKFVTDGGAVGILADQRVGARGFPGSFFGRPTTSSPLPALVARRSKTRIFLVSCLTIRPAYWSLQMTEVPDISPQACADELEKAWRHSPADVFWFENRWKLPRPNSLSFLLQYQPNDTPSRPLRAVILNQPDLILSFPESVLKAEHAEVNFRLGDSDLKKSLFEIDASSLTPVDFFLCPIHQRNRVKKLSGDILILSNQDLDTLNLTKKKNLT